MADKLLAIFLSLLIFMQASIIRRMVGTWMFPACLFGLFWFLLTFIPLVLVFEAPVDPIAVGYILLSCLFFSASAFIVDWRGPYKIRRAKNYRADFGNVFIRKSFYGITIFAFICLMINTLAQGISLGDIIFNIMETANSYISRRYSDELNVTIFGRLSVVFTYTAAVLGGLYYADRPNDARGSMVILFSLAPSAAVMVIQGAKGALFLSLAYFISGILIVKILNNDRDLFKTGNFTIIFKYSLIVIPIVVLSFLVRDPSTSGEIEAIKTGLTRGLLSYSSAHMYAFADWFSHFLYNKSTLNYVDDFNAGGFHTFISVFKFFGSDKYIPEGYYEEYYQYKDVIQSNIYTIFRGLIYDFGLFGSLFFMLGFGVFSHASFLQLLISKNPVVSIAIFTHFIGFVYTSFIISQFVWNSIYVTFLLLCAILYVNNFLKKH